MVELRRIRPAAIAQARSLAERCCRSTEGVLAQSAGMIERLVCCLDVAVVISVGSPEIKGEILGKARLAAWL